MHPLEHRVGKGKNNNKANRNNSIQVSYPMVFCVTRSEYFCLAQGVSSIHAGATYSMAVSGGQLYFWGLTKSTGDATMYPKPVRDMSGWDVRSVGCS